MALTTDEKAEVEKIIKHWNDGKDEKTTWGSVNDRDVDEKCPGVNKPNFTYGRTCIYKSLWALHCSCFLYCGKTMKPETHAVLVKSFDLFLLKHDRKLVPCKCIQNRRKKSLNEDGH